MFSAVVCLVVHFVLNFIAGNDAARILAVFPIPSISHQVVFRPLTHELAKRGHEVVVITPDPAFPKGKAPANLTEIDVHDLSYDSWRKHFITTDRGKQDDLFDQLKQAFALISSIFEMQMKTDEVQKILQDERQKFDLLLIEACARITLGLSHVYKVPVIQVSSFGAFYGNFESVGAPTHPILYSYSVRQRLNNLTMWEKITEMYNEFSLRQMYFSDEKEDDERLKRIFGPDTPTISELRNNVHMLFLNLHPIWDGNRPVPPTVVYMGGLHQKPQKELPKDLKSYLDSSVNGVIYLSFGTNVNTSLLPPEKIQMLVRVFSQLPYDVLWKWDKDDLPGRTKNIRISKWFPQSDLLRHPKVKLFITQGGLQSTDEAITAGVPLIGVPMLGDQWYNVERYVQHKIGLRLDLEMFTEENIRNAINTVIGDKSYRENVVRLRTLMCDQLQHPLDRAVWWTEHVLRHGGARHLRAPAANISYSEYLELELVAVIMVALSLTVTVFVALVYFLFKFVSVKLLFINKVKSN